MAKSEDCGMTTIDLGDQLITIDQVRAKTGFSTATIYRRIAAGTFPQRVAAGERAVRWKLSEIDNWIASLDRPAVKPTTPSGTDSKKTQRFPG